MVDRNQAARERQQQQFQAAQQRKQFIEAVAAGATGALDKEKNLLKPQHICVWNPPKEEILYWLVQDVGPALDQPGPAMRVTLTITVPVIVQPGKRMGNMLVIGEQGKQNPAALARDVIAVPDDVPGQPPPATEPEPPPEDPADGRDSEPPGD